MADNDAVECLNFADLYALIGPEEGVGTWAEGSAIAGELGPSTELPDAELVLTGPGTESGTYDSFVELALEGYAEERGQEPTHPHRLCLVGRRQHDRVEHRVQLQRRSAGSASPSPRRRATR